MFCIYCGAQNADDASSCQACHKRLPPLTSKPKASGSLSSESSAPGTGRLYPYPEPSAQESRLYPPPPPRSSADQHPDTLDLPLLPTRGRFPEPVILAGASLAFIGFLLPWIELHIPLVNLPPLSGINGGLFSWPLLLLLIAAVGLALAEKSLLEQRPEMLPWLCIAPVVVGTLFLMRACDMIAIAIGISSAIESLLRGFSSSSNSASTASSLASLITPGAGAFLMLLGGLLMIYGACRRLSKVLEDESF